MLECGEAEASRGHRSRRSVIAMVWRSASGETKSTAILMQLLRLRTWDATTTEVTQATAPSVTLSGYTLRLPSVLQELVDKAIL